MEMAFKAIPDPPNDVTKLFSLLAWVPVQDVNTFYKEKQKEITDELDKDLQIEQYKG